MGRSIGCAAGESPGIVPGELLVLACVAGEGFGGRQVVVDTVRGSQVGEFEAVGVRPGGTIGEDDR